MHPQTELLFPARLIPELADLRGETWRKLVMRVAALPETHADVIAFMLVISELSECLSCEQGSFRAWRGCAACSAQAVVRYKGSDRQLLRRFENAKKRVEAYLATSTAEEAA
jgi:hypothetical protein